MDQQRGAIVKHIIKCFSCLPLSTFPNLCHQPKSSVINLINDGLLDAWPTVIQMSPQLDQHLAQKFNRFAPIALPRFCNLRTEVWNVKKSQVGRYNWSHGVSRQSCTMAVCSCGGMVKTATNQNGDRSKRRHQNGDKTDMVKTATSQNGDTAKQRQEKTASQNGDWNFVWLNYWWKARWWCIVCAPD